MIEDPYRDSQSKISGSIFFRSQELTFQPPSGHSFEILSSAINFSEDISNVKSPLESKVSYYSRPHSRHSKSQGILPLYGLLFLDIFIRKMQAENSQCHFYTDRNRLQGGIHRGLRDYLHLAYFQPFLDRLIVYKLKKELISLLKSD